MKKIILSIMIFNSLIFANTINWTNIRSALTSTENKPIFVFVSASHCSFCYKAKKAMNNNSSFTNYINEAFIPVYISEDKEFTPEYLYSPVTPTFYVINKNGDYLVSPLRGFIGLKPIIKLLNKGKYNFEER